MRVLLLANNWVGWKIAEFLHAGKEAEIVGVVVHPDTKAKYRNEILETLRLPDSSIFDGSKLQEQKVLSEVQELKPEVGVSAFFGYILHTEFLHLFPKGCLNIHPAYLPYNRGAYPNVWSIIDTTPAGVTIHYIDEAVDTGGIVAQAEIEVLPIDTGE